MQGNYSVLFQLLCVLMIYEIINMLRMQKWWKNEAAKCKRFHSFHFITSLILCGKFGSPYLGKQPREQRYPFLTVRAVFSCVPTKVCAHILVHAIAHEGCVDAERESALKVYWEKNPCHTGESNLPQWRTGPMLYQLSYIPAPCWGTIQTPRTLSMDPFHWT